MSTARGGLPHLFRRVPASGFAVLHQLDLRHAERFLEPLGVILGFVRCRPAHHLVAFEAAGQLAGFYVVHPDRRDRACWWLGWLAIDGRLQGAGLGRSALAAALAGLRRLPQCRRIRLLVAADNAAARRLYYQAGFHDVGRWPATGELVMEAAAVATPGEGGADAVVVPALTLVLAMLMRLWRRGVPPAARMSGEFHGPPSLARALAPSRLAAPPPMR